jgi:hypothetical protein
MGTVTPSTRRSQKSALGELTNRKLICEISGSHGGEYEVYTFLGCSAV